MAARLLLRRYILQGLLGGIPEDPSDPGWHLVWRRTEVIGSVLSVGAIGWEVWRTLARRYWRLDSSGLRRGRVSTLHIPWSEIEQAVIGMPSELHWYWRFMVHIPISTIQAAVASVVDYRARAVVLRLRGERLFVVNLFGRQHRNGAASWIASSSGAPTGSPRPRPIRPSSSAHWRG